MTNVDFVLQKLSDPALRRALDQASAALNAQQDSIVRTMVTAQRATSSWRDVYGPAIAEVARKMQDPAFRRAIEEAREAMGLPEPATGRSAVEEETERQFSSLGIDLTRTDDEDPLPIEESLGVTLPADEELDKLDELVENGQIDDQAVESFGAALTADPELEEKVDASAKIVSQRRRISRERARLLILRAVYINVAIAMMLLDMATNGGSTKILDTNAKEVRRLFGEWLDQWWRLEELPLEEQSELADGAKDRTDGEPESP
ncbi:hypothetical protein RE9425_03020 [Prescottella equi]|nr:hypothetical protein RE9425_03020 [Prescottella equi]